MAKIVSWNADQLVAKARTVTLAYCDSLSQTLKEKIAEERGVGWPNPTRRRNGVVVGASRDIVDTGRLQLSQSFQARADGGVFVWNAPYAMNVVKGAYPGGRPARDWRAWAVDENPLPVFFLREWQRFSVGGIGPGQTY
jgi:hypothetical protein